MLVSNKIINITLTGLETVEYDISNWNQDIEISCVYLQKVQANLLAISYLAS